METTLQYHWKVIFEQSSDAMVIIEADTSVVLEANSSSEKLLGLHIEKLKKILKRY